jgi:SAM-dependent methyltransferase
MSEADRHRWDARYAEPTAASAEVGPPSSFVSFEELFPKQGFALDLACGRGESALWLASRGMEVHGVDVSPVAIELARRRLSATALEDRCRFDVVDLDAGLPDGPPADLILCHLFRDARLYPALRQRLALGGLLAIAVLSEVDAGPGRFRAVRGELRAAFGELEVLGEAEARGIAWLVGRRLKILATGLVLLALLHLGALPVTMSLA